MKHTYQKYLVTEYYYQPCNVVRILIAATLSLDDLIS